jgi:hypothetical protein
LGHCLSLFVFFTEHHLSLFHLAVIVLFQLKIAEGPRAQIFNSNQQCQTLVISHRLLTKKVTITETSKAGYLIIEIYLSTYLSIYLSIYVIYLSSINLFICLSSINLSSIYLSIYNWSLSSTYLGYRHVTSHLVSNLFYLK